MTLRPPTEHHLEFLSFITGGCTGSSVSTLVKIPHCLKSCVTAHISSRCSAKITTLNMTSPKEHVVLVTGGAGFLGQHIIGLLQTRAQHVTEIRVIDLPSNPYINKLGKLQVIA